MRVIVLSECLIDGLVNVSLRPQQCVCQILNGNIRGSPHYSTGPFQEIVGQQSLGPTLNCLSLEDAVRTWRSFKTSFDNSFVTQLPLR
jgi:hypothetical protein